MRSSAVCGWSSPFASRVRSRPRRSSGSRSRFARAVHRWQRASARGSLAGEVSTDQSQLLAWVATVVMRGTHSDFARNSRRTGEAKARPRQVTPSPALRDASSSPRSAPPRNVSRGEWPSAIPGARGARGQTSPVPRGTRACTMPVPRGTRRGTAKAGRRRRRTCELLIEPDAIVVRDG